ncbi:hypothetical protein HYT59_01380 [Candidatus Woesebacteria bacterium]|nr:hypothetical protein [Candidatus Woesebacteria bacterium]
MDVERGGVKEDFDTKQLEIRGHHLNNYFYLYKEYVEETDNFRRYTFPTWGQQISASERMVWRVVYNRVQRMIDAINSRISLPGSQWIEYSAPEHKYSKTSYSLDVLGQTPYEELLFRDEASKLFFSFLTLPDSYPVRIFCNDIDDLCRLCRSGVSGLVQINGGEHCRVSTTADSMEIASWYGRDVPEEIDTTLGELKDKFFKVIQKL